MAEDVTLEFRTRGIAQTIRQFKKLESGLDRTRLAAEKMNQVGRRMTTFVTAPLLAAGGAALKMAADAEETENLFRVSMGNMAGEAEQFATSLAESLRIDPLTVKETLGTFQSMLEGMGLAQERAFDMAQGLARLQLDMASFFNLRPAEVFQKLQSAIAGEIEPLRRLGFVTSQAKIEQVALQEGIADTSDELTEGEKVAARFMAIWQQARDRNILGDMERTMGSMTNTARSLREQVSILAREFGEAMQPAVQPILADMRDFIERLAELSPEAKQTIVVIGGLVAAMGPLLQVLSNLTIASLGAVKGVSALGGAGGALAALGKAGVAGLAIAGIGGVIVGLNRLGENITRPTEDTREMRDALNELAEAGDKASESLFKTAIAAVQSRLAEIRAEMAESAEGMGSDIQEAIQSGEGMVGALQQSNSVMGRLATKAQVLKGIMADLRRESEQFNKAMDPDDPDDPDGPTTSVSQGAPISFAGQALIGQMQAGDTSEIASVGAGGAATILPESLREDAEAIQDTTRQTFDIIKTEGSDGFNTIANTAISSMGTAVQAAITGFDNIASVVINSVTQILQALSQSGGPLGGFLGGFGVPIIGAVGGILGAVLSGGGDDVQKVDVASVSSEDTMNVEEQRDTGPESVIIQVLDSSTGEKMDEIEYQLRRRENRDATRRLPPGTSLGFAGV